MKYDFRLGDIVTPDCRRIRINGLQMSPDARPFKIIEIGYNGNYAIQCIAKDANAVTYAHRDTLMPFGDMLYKHLIEDIADE